MNTNTEHKVCLTLDGRYAVVTPAGETLGEFHDEAPAATYAAALNNGPVSMLGVPRWSQEPEARSQKAA